MTATSFNQVPYRICISHDGREFIAEVRQLPECIGKGWSYAAALADAERLIGERNAVDRDDLDRLARQSREAVLNALNQSKGTAAIVGDMLRNKFGNVSMRELSEKIGQGCSVRAFNSAVAGAGSRKTRLLIALSLNVLPSQLWKSRSFSVRKMDDRDFLKLRNQMAMGSEVLAA